MFSIIRLVINKNTFRRGFCTSLHKEKWDLLTAVCIQRMPIITPQLSDLEKRYMNLLSELEFEQSLKSDFELRDEKDRKAQESLKKGEDLDVVVKQTAQDFLDASSEELAIFKFGNRTTEDDVKNNLQSLNRKLDKHLMLLVKQTLGKDSHYMFPQGHLQDGETLRQCAERVTRELCGAEVKAQFYGNAPSGLYKYKYPKKVQEKNKSIGAKIFIYTAKYKDGTLKSGVDYKWMDKAELSKELHPNYYYSAAQFLIDER